MHTLGKPVGTTSLATDTYQLRVWLGLSEFRLKAWTNVSSVVQLLLSRLVIQKKCFVNVLPYWIFLCFLSVQFNYPRTLYSFNWRHFKRCISFLYLSSMKCILNALSCRLKVSLWPEFLNQYLSIYFWIFCIKTHTFLCGENIFMLMLEYLEANFGIFRQQLWMNVISIACIPITNAKPLIDILNTSFTKKMDKWFYLAQVSFNFIKLILNTLKIDLIHLQKLTKSR